jgi:two-component system response regulator AtoC
MDVILVVDDDPNVCNILKGLLEHAGYAVLTAYEGDKALAIIGEREVDLVVTDLKMPGTSGIDLLTLCHERKAAVPVIVMTAYGTIEAAVASMRKGAYDFITKPFDENELLAVIQKALAESRKNQELITAYFDKDHDFSLQFIGRTAAIEKILQTIQKIAPTDVTVLISGETGVGKELVARQIHMSSHRRDRPFIKVNCAAIPETLLESELFGHEKGAFTGAVSSKPGRFELAHQGTIFLDEIGDLPLHLQTKLLTVLQDKSFERVGGVKTIEVDIRIVAATNRDLSAAVQAGTFRSDLFYRLNVLPIYIPPIRDRKEDLIPLVDHFVTKFATKYRRTVTHIAPEVIAVFSSYDWPGNIRELENVLERMMVMSEEDILGLDLLPTEISGKTLTPGPSGLKEKLESISSITEKQMIIDALNQSNQNRTRAAKLLGISRRTLQHKIKEYGL